MKKIICFLLIVAFAFSLCACGASEEEKVEDLLQGVWKSYPYEDVDIELSYEFDDGRITVGMTVADAGIENVGDYRIDAETNEIYVCYDYIYSASGEKTANSEEILLITYTLNGSKLALTNSTGDILEKD